MSPSKVRVYRILLVEDNDGDIYLIKMALRQAGIEFDLTVFNDGESAITYFGDESNYRERGLPDLTVLDLNLPKRDGLEVLEAIRRNPNLVDLPVVVMTSSSSSRDRARIEGFGDVQCHTKPPDLEGFLHFGEVLKELLYKAERGEAPAA